MVFPRVTKPSSVCFWKGRQKTSKHRDGRSSHIAFVFIFAFVRYTDSCLISNTFYLSMNTYERVSAGALWVFRPLCVARQGVVCVVVV